MASNMISTIISILRYCQRANHFLHTRAVISAAIVAHPEAIQGAGSVRDTAEKQNVRMLGDDGFENGMHAAVVVLHPLLPVVRSAVRVTVTGEATGIEVNGWTRMATTQHSPASVIGNRVQSI